MKHHIIYISGLGNRYDGLLLFLLFFWHVFGVKTEFVAMKWYGGTSYQEKFDRVIATIERAEAKGYTVLLIGESAGASMAMNVFAQRDSLHRLVSLCGVNSPHASFRAPAYCRVIARYT